MRSVTTDGRTVTLGIRFGSCLATAGGPDRAKRCAAAPLDVLRDQCRARMEVRENCVRSNGGQHEHQAPGTPFSATSLRCQNGQHVHKHAPCLERRGLPAAKCGGGHRCTTSILHPRARRGRSDIKTHPLPRLRKRSVRHARHPAGQVQRREQTHRPATAEEAPFASAARENPPTCAKPHPARVGPWTRWRKAWLGR